MMYKRKGGFAKIIQALMFIAAFIVVFVFIYMIYNSLRSKSDVLSNTLGLPEGFSLDNYIRLFVNDHFERYFLNSILILAGSLLLMVLLSSMVAYALGRYRFAGNKFLRLFFLLGLMFPAQLGIVPIFLMMKNVQLIDSYTSVILILGSGISMPVFMLTDTFQKLPGEIYEAAIIDGAGEWLTFRKIMLPLAKPVVFSVCVINAVNIWNQFFIPLIFIQSESKKTVPLIIVKYTKNLISTMDLALAASVMSTVPILIVFIVFSKKILEGFSAGGVKG